MVVGANWSLQEVTQPEPAPQVQDDARSRVAALDANSTQMYQCLSMMN